MDGLGCIVAAVLLLGSIAASDASSYGLDTLLAQEFKADPTANNDTFDRLRPGLKSFLSSPRHSIESKLQSITSLQSTTPVTVKLVGFSRDDKSRLERQLQDYLHILNKNDHVHVIGTGGTSNHRLNVRSKIEIDVVRSGGGLDETIYRAIESHVDRPSSLSSHFHAPVPYTAVDDLVRADLEPPLASYVIYILNLRRQARSYGYDYQPGDGDELHSAFTKCLGNLWMGRGERYVWIDLAAGPIEYGPALTGDGLVLRDELYPYAAAFHESPAQKALLADLAALVWSCSQMLLAPAIRIPVYYDRELEVHFYHIRQGNGSGEAEEIRWEEMEGSLKNEAGLLFQGQTLVFRKFVIEMDECGLCSALIARSTKSYTSRVLIERYALFVTDYIDSQQLHHLLAENQAELERLAGSTGHAGNYMARIVPVYVFDLRNDRILLLDRDHQSMAFRDMILAVRSKGYQTVSEFNCNKRPMMVETRKIERPVVASLLQTLWGVSPTYLTWSSQHKSTFVDYTWSLGNTPFGPFSRLATISFAQRDAAPRNVLHTMLNTTVWGATEVLHALRGLGGERALLRGKQGLEMNQRWNLLVYKLNKATSAMSHFDFNLALFLLKSAEHDLYAAHRLVYDAASKLEAAMVCFKDAPFPWLLLGLVLAAAACAMYAWFRRDKLFASKRKRF